MNKKVTVLIADDEQAIRNGLKAIVTRDFEEVLVLGCVATGEQALEMLERYKPDIAVMDINMPNMDGLEVIRQAKKDSLPTRFLILSGYGEFSYAQKAISYGVKNYFLKPLNIEEFRTVFLQQCQEILSQRKNGSASEKEIARLRDSSRTLFLNHLVQKKYNSSAGGYETLRLSIENKPNFAAIFLLNPSAPQASSVDEKACCETVQTAFFEEAMECWFYAQNQIVAIFNRDSTQNEKFRAKLQRCLQELKKETGCEVQAGLGTVVSGFSQTGVSYARAQEALSYRIYTTKETIFDCADIPQHTPVFTQENIDFEPLMRAVFQSDTHLITTYCEAFFQSLLTQGNPPPSFVVGMCMYLLLNTQKQVQMNRPDKKIEFDFSYEELSGLGSIQEMCEWLIRTLCQYSQQLKDLAGDENRNIRIAKEYIRNHLSQNLKAKDVAAQVNLSEAYFTIYFKEKVGINFRDYLLKVRIEYAKQMLKSHVANINEIAYSIGYQDYRSFSRAFKNETGMTPSEYQNQC